MRCKKRRWKLICMLAAGSLFTAVFLTPEGTVLAAEPPEGTELMWDMENLPENLYETELAWDVAGGGGGHSKGYMDAARAEGKGVNGSTAAAITFTEDCPPASLWADAVYLRIDQDPTANVNWLGVKEFWFWLDLSEFNSDHLYLDLMIDGVLPELDQPYTLIKDGTRTANQTIATYDEAVFGRLSFPAGFVGWVGIPASAFHATFGTIQNVSFGLFAADDAVNFPLSMYVDELRIIRGNTDGSALFGGGELFNQDVAPGDKRLYTDFTDTHQTVKSYGASGAWWSTAYGTEEFVDDLLGLVFTDEGAGLNNYRHNIGGSVKTDLSDAGNKGMRDSGRAIPSPLTEEGTYDEDRDLGAFTVLQKLKDLGTIDDFTLFINSPPSTMTNNALTYGDSWAEDYSNLREDCYEAFAEYVVDMVQLYNYAGIPVSYISPVNEPQLDWTKGNQEGCHYDPLEVTRIHKLIAAELKERIAEDPTLTNVRMSISESNSWTDKNYLNYMYYQMTKDPVLKEMVGNICAHSYGGTARDKRKLALDMENLNADISLRETEYGPTFAEPDFTITSGLDVARVMYEDLSILDVDGWSYWLAAANGSFTDGLVYFNTGAKDLIPSKRLWAMGQYARFTKGAVRVGVDESGMPEDVCTTAYVNPADGSLIYVIVNSSGQDQIFSFDGLPDGALASVYETSAIRSLSLRGTMTADNGYNLPAESITTFVFEDLDLTAVQPGRNPDNPDGTAANEETVSESAESLPVPDGNRSAALWAAVIGGLAAAASAAALIILQHKKK